MRAAHIVGQQVMNALFQSGALAAAGEQIGIFTPTQFCPLIDGKDLAIDAIPRRSAALA